MTLALIGLGSNLGDRKANLDLAVALLSETPGASLQAVSSYHETEPVGGPGGQGAFLNAAAALETTLEPGPLLGRLNAIEHEAGRVRSVRWGDRTLDLDLLTYGDETINTPRLHVPHPRMALRRFVLAPLSEVAPAVVDPVTGRRIRDLLDNLDRRPSYLAFATMPSAVPLEPRPPSRTENRLYHELIRLLSAIPIEHKPGENRSAAEQELDRIKELLANRLSGTPPIEVIARTLDPSRWKETDWGDRWLVSHFWLDALFLWMAQLQRITGDLTQEDPWFQLTRDRVIAPTFVVARPCDQERLGLLAPNLSWRNPIGRDTPVLIVEDFTSQAALDEVLAALRGDPDEVIGPFSSSRLSGVRGGLYNPFIRSIGTISGRTTMAKSGAGKGAKGKADDESIKIVARNRRARFEYDLIDSLEAGIVLTGTEVKSLRTGKASLEESYAAIQNDEVWLYGCDIPEYLQANQMNHKSKRPRKLLLHRLEIDKLIAKASEKGLTIVPLKIYFKNGMAKVEICVARGRKTYDKREALKNKDAKRDMDRALRGRG